MPKVRERRAMNRLRLVDPGEAQATGEQVIAEGAALYSAWLRQRAEDLRLSPEAREQISVAASTVLLAAAPLLSQAFG